MTARNWQYGVALLALQGLVACSGDDAPADARVNDTAAASAAPSAAAPLPADAPLVVAFGDSLYAGYGVAQNEAFPAELQRALAAAGTPADVRNAGVSGETTAGGRERLAFVLDGLPRKPDLVVLGLGGNDMLRGLSPTETRANLAAMLAMLRERQIPVLLTGMLAAPNLGRDYADAFNPIYPELAREYDAALYPFFLDGVVTRPELMQADRLHPTPEGIDAIVGKVAPLVAKQLNN